MVFELSWTVLRRKDNWLIWYKAHWKRECHFFELSTIIEGTTEKVHLISEQFHKIVGQIFEFVESIKTIHRSYSWLTCGLYYKHTMIVKYTSSVVNKLEAFLTDDARVVIYDHHVFIVQAGNTKEGSITVQLTSCLTCLD